MPTKMKYALGLKFLGGMSFLAAIITAGAMNRSIGIVFLFAIAMTVAALILRRQSGPGLDVATMMGAPGQGAEKKGFFDGALNMFVSRALGVAVLFGLTILISALFRETDILTTMNGTDMLLVGLPLAITLGAGFASQQMMAGMGEELAAVMGQMQSKMADMQAARAGQPGSTDMNPGAPANDDSVIDGEFEEIKPEDDTSGPKQT